MLVRTGVDALLAHVVWGLDLVDTLETHIVRRLALVDANVVDRSSVDSSIAAVSVVMSRRGRLSRLGLVLPVPV